MRRSQCSRLAFLGRLRKGTRSRPLRLRRRRGCGLCAKSVLVCHTLFARHEFCTSLWQRSRGEWRDLALSVRRYWHWRGSELIKSTLIGSTPDCMMRCAAPKTIRRLALVVVSSVVRIRRFGRSHGCAWRVCHLPWRRRCASTVINFLRRMWQSRNLGGCRRT